MTEGRDESGLDRIAERLERERPIPAPGFRGELRRELIAGVERRPARRIRVLVAAYAASGAALMLVAAIGVAGAGPLAA